VLLCSGDWQTNERKGDKLDYCDQHSGIDSKVTAIKEQLDKIEQKMERHYPRELVYVIGILGTALGVVTTLLVQSFR
jgi:hypothetical protein